MVYIRYGEPDFRSSSDKPNLLISPEVEAVRTRMAVDMYGPECRLSHIYWTCFSNTETQLEHREKAFGT